VDVLTPEKNDRRMDFQLKEKLDETLDQCNLKSCSFKFTNRLLNLQIDILNLQVDILNLQVDILNLQVDT
jgi:hypothetical protein